MCRHVTTYLGLHFLRRLDAGQSVCSLGQSVGGSTMQGYVQYGRESFECDVMCYRVVGRGEDFIVGLLRAVKADFGGAHDRVMCRRGAGILRTSWK